ncbi:MAG: exo-alpha-sialidase [Ignavibacteria bacterium]
MKELIYTLVFLSLVSSVNAQWQPDVRLTISGDSYTSYNNAWCIASSGSFVHVVMSSMRNNTNPEIYYKRSTDSGISWSADIRLSDNNSAFSSYPTVAVSGSFVHVIWVDERDGGREIYYKLSTNAGLSWGSDTRLTNNQYGSLYPSLAVFGSVVHVVWTRLNGSGRKEIYYKRSLEGGLIWEEEINLTNNPDIMTGDASIAISGSIVHVVWNDYRDGNLEIYYRSSTNAGSTWGAVTRLTNDPSTSLYPCISIFGSVVHVVWQDNRDGNLEIYCKRSTDGGISWGADTRLTNNTAGSVYSSIAVSSSVVHVVWQDNRDGNLEIYCKRSTDGGISWGADTRLTNNTGSSEYSSVAVSGSVVHVVWSDDRDGHYEIFYKRNPTGNTIGIQNISSDIPDKFSLLQNHPNPFNPMTKIRFDIANGFPVITSGNEKVVLKVYNVMGREVQTLVDERLQPGTYETSFDGSVLNSGVYFYKLISYGYSETKKMLLIK